MTLPPLTLVLGGARSGKSRHAETLVEALPAPWTYLATAQAYDVCLKHLNGSSFKGRRKNAVLSVAASVAFSLLVAAGIVLALMVWRGFI